MFILQRLMCVLLVYTVGWFGLRVSLRREKLAWICHASWVGFAAAFGGES
ncbi:MAG: hypothetical protein ACYTA5_24790 [Planctomycetota bacterium]|jgi:hypothetical protein